MKSEHSLYEVVDECLTVSPISPPLERMPLLRKPSPRCSKLKSPQKVISLLEMRPNGIDLINKIIHGDNAKFTKRTLNQSVIGERDPLMIDLAEPTLVDKFADGFSCGITE